MLETLFILLFRLMAHLPLALLHNLGAVAGWLVWWASPKYRRHFRLQIEQAGFAEFRRAAIAEAGKGLFELPKVWLRPHEEVVEQVVKVSGWELVEAACAVGRGVILLTPHLGCFEIAAQYCAKMRPITVLYRRPKNPRLAPLIEGRRSANVRLAPADLSGVRRLLKALRAGEVVGLLPDQVPGNGEGVWVPFFDRPAYTMTLAARLAQTGAIVLMGYAERLPYGAGYHLQMLAPQESPADDLIERTAQLNRELETIIRRCPEQYFWGYNRYKGEAPKA